MGGKEIAIITIITRDRSTDRKKKILYTFYTLNTYTSAAVPYTFINTIRLYNNKINDVTRGNII